jgi:hypothetical protein
MCIDLRSKGLTGKAAEAALDKAGITANKNTIPFDPEKPFVTSGLRLGTPAVTTRGMKEADMAQVAAFIDEAISHHADDAYLSSVAAGKEVFGGLPLIRRCSKRRLMTRPRSATAKNSFCRGNRPIFTWVHNTRFWAKRPGFRTAKRVE